MWYVDRLRANDRNEPGWRIAIKSATDACAMPVLEVAVA